MQTRSFFLGSSLILAVPLVLPLTVSAAGDARGVVGTAVSPGTFSVAHTPANGTATVLEGDEVESAASASKIMLKNGTELDLMPHTAGSIYASHATLKDGTIQGKLASQYAVSSPEFTVRATEPRTQAILQASLHSLTVSIPTGGADVMDASGTRLVHMLPGTTLDFGATGGATTTAALAADKIDTSVNVVRILGVLDNENGHWLVRDRTTNTVSELVGPVDAKMSNKLVMVDGNQLTNSSSKVQQVDRLVQVSKVARSDAAVGLPCRVDGAGGIAKIVHLDGALSKIRDHFLLQDKKQGTFELVGDVTDKDVGTNMSNVKGFVLPKRQALLPAESVVYTEHRKFIAAESPCAGAILGGTMITTGMLVHPNGSSTAVAAVKQAPISF